MLIFPAIDLFGGNAVRLYKGDYSQMTVYSAEPCDVARDFLKAGATHMHIVDLEGARFGGTPNIDTIMQIRAATGLFIEVGGGIRSMEVIGRYVGAGIDRVILGTAAVENEQLLISAAEKYGDRIAVGVDVRDGFVAIKGWTENTAVRAADFCEKLVRIGIKTVICTDISRDGAMQGPNSGLYRELSRVSGVKLIASGGVSSLIDVIRLRDEGLYGAIIGKAYYTGAIDLALAVREGAAAVPNGDGGNFSGDLSGNFSAAAEVVR